MEIQKPLVTTEEKIKVPIGNFGLIMYPTSSSNGVFGFQFGNSSLGANSGMSISVNQISNTIDSMTVSGYYPQYPVAKIGSMGGLLLSNRQVGFNPPNMPADDSNYIFIPKGNIKIDSSDSYFGGELNIMGNGYGVKFYHSGYEECAVQNTRNSINTFVFKVLNNDGNLGQINISNVQTNTVNADGLINAKSRLLVGQPTDDGQGLIVQRNADVYTVGDPTDNGSTIYKIGDPANNSSTYYTNPNPADNGSAANVDGTGNFINQTVTYTIYAYKNVGGKTIYSTGLGGIALGDFSSTNFHNALAWTDGGTSTGFVVQSDAGFYIDIGYNLSLDDDGSYGGSWIAGTFSATPQGFNNDNVNYSVYAYRTVNSIKFYSKTPAAINISDISGINYLSEIDWTSVTDADGYLVQSDKGYYIDVGNVLQLIDNNEYTGWSVGTFSPPNGFDNTTVTYTVYAYRTVGATTFYSATPASIPLSDLTGARFINEINWSVTANAEGYLIQSDVGYYKDVGAVNTFMDDNTYTGWTGGTFVPGSSSPLSVPVDVARWYGNGGADLRLTSPGDLKFMDTAGGQGIVLYDPTNAGYYRVTLDNGLLQINPE